VLLTASLSCDWNAALLKLGIFRIFVILRNGLLCTTGRRRKSVSICLIWHRSTLPACSGIYYYRLKTNNIQYQQLDKTLWLASRQRVSAVTRPLLDQSGTQSRYIESVHSIGSHMVYNN
jgi:hypothetical protein